MIPPSRAVVVSPGTLFLARVSPACRDFFVIYGARKRAPLSRLQAIYVTTFSIPVLVAAYEMFIFVCSKFQL